MSIIIEERVEKQQKIVVVADDVIGATYLNIDSSWERSEEALNLFNLFLLYVDVKLIIYTRLVASIIN